MDNLLFAGALLLFTGFVVASIAAIVRWHGAWRVVAFLPLLYVVFVATRIVIGTQNDPTSHNLWPFEILIAAVIGLVAMGVLFAGHRMSGARVGTT